MESALYQDIFSKGETRGKADGKAEANAETIVGILAHRIGAVDPAVRERVLGVSDMTTLSAWYREALLVVDADGARRLAEKILNAPLV